MGVDDGAPVWRDTAAPLSVGIIAPPWVAVPPAAYGGTEAVLDGLARGLSAAGCEVTMYTTGDSSCPVRKLWTFPAAVGIGAGVTAELQHVADAYRRLTAVDVLHDHTVLGPLHGARLATVPVVTTVHGPFDRASAPIHRAASRRAAVVAISHDQARTALGIPISAVIHHGIDVAAVPFGDGGGRYAAFVGRMSPVKGVHLAIRAARRAGTRLLIAARMCGPDEVAYFETVVRPLLGPDVEFLGEVTIADKWALLGGASCLLNPIQWAEPFGMVMIEALASGTPVVTTSRGAAPEIVEHGVTGVLGDSPAALSEGVVAASALDRGRCRASAEARFSIERMASDHLGLYQRLRAERPVPRPA